MALARTSRGAGSTNAGGQSTYPFSPTSNCGIAIGTLLLLEIAHDNSGASGVDPIDANYAATGAAITDSVGNIWNVINGVVNTAGVANDGVAVRTATCNPKFPITTSDTITISYNGITTVARTWALTEITAGAGKYVQGAGGTTVTATGSSTTPSVVSVSPAVNELVAGCMGAQGNAAITPDSDTLNGNWSTQQTSGVGVTTAGMEIASQDKIVSNAGAQTYNLSITSAIWACIIRNYREATIPAYLTRIPYGSLVQPQVRGGYW